MISSLEITDLFGIYPRKSAFASLTLGLSTVALFVYILLIPLIKGQQPNVRPEILPFYAIS